MSSAGYANRLSEYSDKGICGLPESLDSERSLKNKLAKLAKLVTEAKGKVVILTGAGVSTSAGIPDFRGPNGIWTTEEREKKKEEEQQQKKKRQKKRRGSKKASMAKSGSGNKDGAKNNGKEDGSNGETKDGAGEANTNANAIANGPQTTERESDFYNSPKRSPALKRKRDVNENGNEKDPINEKGQDNAAAGKTAADTQPPPPSPSFENCRPTLTHRAITKLASLGIVRYVITQNVDGLHRRSGLPRSKHAVLHGCVFTEKCEKCGEEYFRDVDLGGVSFKKTGRQCTATPGCGGDLRDTILDWEDPLPEEDWDRAQDECDDADLVITLGTSLRIEPAGGLPLRAKKFVIVNLQVTPYDGDASIIIRAKVDQVMSSLMTSLDIERWDESVGEEPRPEGS